MSLSLKSFYSTLGSWSCPTIDCWHTQLCMVFPITFEAGITKNRCLNESVNFSKSHCCHTPSSRTKSDRIWGNLSCALFTYPLIVSYFPIASSDSRASAVFYRTHECLLHFHHVIVSYTLGQLCICLSQTFMSSCFSTAIPWPWSTDCILPRGYLKYPLLFSYILFLFPLLTLHHNLCLTPLIISVSCLKLSKYPALLW